MSKSTKRSAEKVWMERALAAEAQVKHWEDKEVRRAVNCCGQEERAVKAEDALASALAQSEGDRELLTETRAALGEAMKERDEARGRAEAAEKRGAPRVTPCERCGKPTPVQLGSDDRWHDGVLCCCDERDEMIAAEQSLAALRGRVEARIDLWDQRAAEFDSIGEPELDKSSKRCEERAAEFRALLAAAPAPAPEEPCPACVAMASQCGACFSRANPTLDFAAAPPSADPALSTQHPPKESPCRSESVSPGCGPSSAHGPTADAPASSAATAPSTSPVTSPPNSPSAPAAESGSTSPASTTPERTRPPVDQAPETGPERCPECGERKYTAQYEPCPAPAAPTRAPGREDEHG